MTPKQAALLEALAAFKYQRGRWPITGEVRNIATTDYCVRWPLEKAGLIELRSHRMIGYCGGGRSTFWKLTVAGWVWLEERKAA